MEKVYEKHPSLAPKTDQSPRNPPRNRYPTPPEFDDSVGEFHNLSEKNCPPDFKFDRRSDCVVYYNLKFDGQNFPKIFETIRIDEQMHVQLQYNGSPVPLPSWFTKGTNGKLIKKSQLENFPAYIRSKVEDKASLFPFLEELTERKNYDPKGRPPYSSDLLRYALLLKHTSLQSYSLILKKFPMPSLSLLRKLERGGVDAIKSAKLLRDKGKMSEDIMLIFDEMYLQKQEQYQDGAVFGTNEEGQLYKGIVCFMIVGLKKSVPYLIKTCPEIKIEGTWLANEIHSAISDLSLSGFNVRAVVSDNHSTNVKAHSILLGDTPENVFFEHPDSKNKVYLFFDNVHLLKNIRNNLYNAGKFVFPPFSFVLGEKSVNSSDGYILWKDLGKVYDADCKLPGYLRKAKDLTYTALHPVNKKMNVKLALAIFSETTIAALKSYFPEMKEMSSFLELISTWWTIVNSNAKYAHNSLGNAIIPNDFRLAFLEEFALWIESWSSKNFNLTPHTSKALSRTLRAQILLIEDLFNEGYQFVCMRKLQSDPLERRFGQYRQMSGGRFLVSMREVVRSEKILSYNSLLKEDINVWENNLAPVKDITAIVSEISSLIEKNEIDLHDACLTDDSSEVAVVVAGYIAKKLKERSKCRECKLGLTCNIQYGDQSYFNLLSRGGLTKPPQDLADLVIKAFAILDSIASIIMKFPDVVKQASEMLLTKYCLDFGLDVGFACPQHTCYCRKWILRPVVNVFFNNKRKIVTYCNTIDQVVGCKKSKLEKR